MLAWFTSDADCRDYLEWLRWPDGFLCSERGHVRGWRLVTVDGCARAARTAISDGWHDLRSDPDAVDGVVHRLLVVRDVQGPNLGACPAADLGDRLISDRVGDVAPAAVRTGPTGSCFPAR